MLHPTRPLRHPPSIIRSMRLFFCLELAPNVRERLAKAIECLRSQLRQGAKWVEPNNLHVTVRFLGEVPEQQAAKLLAEGQKVAAETSIFDLQLEKLSAFPNPRRARVIWAGPKEDSAQFSALAQKIEAMVQGLGLAPEKRKAEPHVTLARLRSPKDIAQTLAQVPFSPIVLQVRMLTLMLSELKPEGPIYTPLARWPLREHAV